MWRQDFDAITKQVSFSGFDILFCYFEFFQQKKLSESQIAFISEADTCVIDWFVRSFYMESRILLMTFRYII